MKSLIYRVKQYIPKTVWRKITAPYWWWYNRASHQIAAILDRRLSRSQETVRSFKDRHIDERCFIIGNGPSLKDTDLSLLRNEITFGVNRLYLLFPQLGFETTYYLSVNTLVIEQCAEEIMSLHMPRFITWRGRRWLKQDEDMIFLDTDYTDPEDFSFDVSDRVYEGSTVTYVALQLAFYMGFKEVILIGVDHSFDTKGQPNATVVSDGDDPNHFSPDYFGKGFRWQLPDLEASERAYRMAADAYREHGRKVLDATIDGRLQVFPKIRYESLF